MDFSSILNQALICVIEDCSVPRDSVWILKPEAAKPNLQNPPGPACRTPSPPVRQAKFQSLLGRRKIRRIRKDIGRHILILLARTKVDRYASVILNRQEILIIQGLAGLKILDGDAGFFVHNTRFDCFIHDCTQV